MSGPGDAPAPEEKKPLLPHTPPMDFPPTSLVGVAVPKDFNAVIIAAAAKNNLVYNDQLLAWAQKGAECERLHEPRPVGRKRK